MYANNTTGVKRLLINETDIEPMTLARSKYEPDPSVRGCWLVTLPDGLQVLTYVGSHPLAPSFEEL